MRKRAGLTGLVLMVGCLALSGCLRFAARSVRTGQIPKRGLLIEVEGVRLHVRDRGHGPAVLFLHGYGSAGMAWNKLIRAMVPGFRAVTVDLPGFGFSDKKKMDYSAKNLARLLRGLLIRLGIRRCHLAAHSWGATVGLTLAALYPEMVGKLVVIAGWLYPGQVAPFFSWARRPVAGEILFSLFYRQRIADRYASAYFNPEKHVTQQVVERIEEAVNRPGAVAAALAVIRAHNPRWLVRRLGRIGKPALLLWGREDHVSPLKYGERLASDLPRARLEVLPRCGHLPMIEHPNIVASLVSRFLFGRRRDYRSGRRGSFGCRRSLGAGGGGARP